jgi:glycerol-3-phosphate dehydrogenase subunit C
MLRRFYPRLLGSEEAETVAGRAYDLGEYLVLMQARGSLDMKFCSVPETYLYHTPCHLRSLGDGLVGSRLRMLRQVPDVSIVELDRGCCGLAGSFGMARGNRALSRQIGSDLFDAVRESPGCRVLTECPGCKLQIEREAGVEVLHPAQLLGKAYGL